MTLRTRGSQLQMQLYVNRYPEVAVPRAPG